MTIKLIVDLDNDKDIETVRIIVEALSPQTIPLVIEPAIKPSVKAETLVKPIPDAKAVTLDVNAAVDVNGTRWDARIHSSGKTIVAAGTWKQRKGVSQDLIDTVINEQNTAYDNIENDSTEEVVTPSLIESNTFDKQERSDPIPPPPVEAHTIRTFSQLIASITSNGIGTDTLMMVCKNIGVNHIGDLTVRPDLIEQAVRELGL